MSSTKIISRPEGGSSFAFSRNARLVTTVRRPACAAADSIPARPAVKFKFTTVLPASVAARFTRDPPTLDGRRIPTTDWPSQRGRRAQGDRQGTGKGLEVGDARCPGVGEGQPPRMSARPANELVVQRSSLLLAVRPGFLAQLADGLPELEETGVRRHRRTERDRDRIGDSLGQPPMARGAEDAAHQAIQVHRDDRRGPPLDDPRQSALEGCHHAGPRELALREHADELAIVERLAGLAERLQDHLGTAASRRSGSPSSPAGTSPGAASRSRGRRPRSGSAGRCWRTGRGRRRTRRDWGRAGPPPRWAHSTGPGPARDRACGPVRAG